MNVLNSVPMLTGLVLLLGTLSATPVPAEEPAASQAQKPADTEPRVSWQAAGTLVYSQGEWILLIHYTNKGTRSEGQDGILRKNGQDVKPSKDGEVLDTALGQIKHYGAERKPLWDVTGWNFADKKRIMLSSQVKTTAANTH